MINFVTKGCQWLDWGVRIFDTLLHGKKVVEKISNYNSNWQFQDYVHVGVEGGYVISNVMIIKSERELSRQPSCDETGKSKLNMWKGMNYGCYLVQKISVRQRTISEVLLSEENLWHLSDLAKAHNLPWLGGGLKLWMLGGYLKRWFELVLTNRNLDIKNFIPLGDHGNLVFPITLDYSTIPEEHENNNILRLYRCPITQSLIRYPVAIVAHGVSHFFELAALAFWLNQNPNSTDPVTNEPLRLEDIQINLQALKEIQNEMMRLNIPLI